MDQTCFVHCIAVEFHLQLDGWARPAMAVRVVWFQIGVDVAMTDVSRIVSRLAASFRLAAARAGVGFYPVHDLDMHLSATIDWLRCAQDATPDGGVAQSYFVKRGVWTNSYPETTGYIIPTMLRYAEVAGDEDARERAKRMADWECEIQLPDGGVVAGAVGDSDRPTVFNTGQVLFGFVVAAEAFGAARYERSAREAADWLCAAQDDDGCWRRFGSPMTADAVNVYNTRTAWALARAHQLTGEQRYLDAAVSNCDWAMTRRQENGWFADNCLLDPAQPFVHTIAYAMRGLLEVGVCAQRQEFIDAAASIGDAMVEALPESGFLPGRFDSEWRGTVRWSCLTGNAQLAVNLGRLYQLRGDSRYREAVFTLNRFNCRTQALSGDPPVRGGVKGSHPIDGGYHPWQYPNWAAKFFADALMMEADLRKEQRSGTAGPHPAFTG